LIFQRFPLPNVKSYIYYWKRHRETLIEVITYILFIL
jgi:hypothetical protein